MAKLRVVSNDPTPTKKALLRVTDPDKPLSPSVYQSPAQINKDNAFAEDFNKRHNLTPGIGIIAGKNVGDPVVQFRTEDGKPYVPQQMPASMIKNSVPDWVNKLEWDKDWQMPYYKDGNDMVYVNKQFYNSPRFVRPQAPTSILTAMK